MRELLIKLGFQTDKRAINDTNRAITGFKTRFAIAATAATYAFSAVKKFFDNIASATLDADELAKTLGLSFNELRALQQGFGQFRINDAQVGQILGTLQKDLNEFIQGFGRLPEIARQFGIEISREMNVTQLFDTIIQKLREVENEQDRIRIASALFGQELGPRISELSKDFEGFKKSISESSEALKNLPSITQQAKAYEQALNGISFAFSNLATTIGQYLFPVLEKLINYLDYVLRFYGSIATLDFTTLKAVLSEGSAKADSIFGSISSTLGNAKNSVLSTAASFLPERLSNYITNSIEINVPPGTTTEQAQDIADGLDGIIREAILGTFYEIQNNNPQVE